MELSSISFPVYPLDRYHAVVEELGVVHIYDDYGKFILDNKNLPGDSLGKRRLRILDKDSLYHLGHAYFTLKDLIKYKQGNSNFVDSNGKVFKYRKSSYVRLAYHRIASVVEVEDSVYIQTTKYSALFRVPPELGIMWYKDKYAGIIDLMGGQMLYDISEEKKENSLIMV